MKGDYLREFVNREYPRIMNRIVYGCCSICREPLNGSWCDKCKKLDYGICPICGKTRTGICWCQHCEGLEYINKFNKWTSGNEVIDKFLRKTQVNPKHFWNVWEWIPYTQFMDIQFLGEGGFSTIESAIWLEGPRNMINYHMKSTVRGPNKKIVLKRLHNSRNNSKELVRELQIIHDYQNIFIVGIYGISQHPETDWCNGGTVIKEFDDIQINTESLKQYCSETIDVSRKLPNLPEYYIHTFNSLCVKQTLKFGENSCKRDPKKLIDDFIKEIALKQMHIPKDAISNMINEEQLIIEPARASSELSQVKSARAGSDMI
ncbi:15019_t:CDS:2, partial [Racocetra persica]